MIENLQSIWRDDPLKCQQMLWPHVQFYDKQRELIESVRDNKETIAVAGNMLGKDFVAGFVVLWYFLAHYDPDLKESSVRIVTTSVKADHLRVLWAEIVKFVSSSTIPLTADKGGPLVLLSMEVRHVSEQHLHNPVNYLLGQVSAKGEGMSGHHARNAMIVVDEASGVDQDVYDHASEWAKKKFIFGNPNPCNNFFFKGVKLGDKKMEGEDHYLRKIIQIKATHSPNIRLAQAEISKNGKPSKRRLVPGVMTWEEYTERRENWDKVLQTIKLDAEFYEGPGVLMFPPEWLNMAEEVAASLPKRRKGEAMGIDTAEGGDSTCWSVVDNNGLIEQISMKTPDTSVICGKTIGLMQEYAIPPQRVVFDRGGGGYEHRDYIRLKGYEVRAVGFGEAATPEPVRHLKPWEEKVEDSTGRFKYKNKRMQMYAMLMHRINPTIKDAGVPVFGLPAEYEELRRQLAPLPLLYDEEGKLYLPPKRKKPGSTLKVETIEDILGCSPDEADSLVLAVYAMDEQSTPITLSPMM